MKKIKNALTILKNRAKKNTELQHLYEEEKLNHKIALVICRIREAQGLTQAELAKKVGTTQSVISRLEDADYEGHSLTMLQRVASALERKLEVQMVHPRVAHAPKRSSEIRV